MFVVKEYQLSTVYSQSFYFPQGCKPFSLTQTESAVYLNVLYPSELVEPIEKSFFTVYCVGVGAEITTGMPEGLKIPSIYFVGSFQNPDIKMVFVVEEEKEEGSRMPGVKKVSNLKVGNINNPQVITFVNGKYEVRYNEDPFIFEALCYEKPFRDLTGDNLALGMFLKIKELMGKLDEANERNLENSRTIMDLKVENRTLSGITTPEGFNELSEKLREMIVERDRLTEEIVRLRGIGTSDEVVRMKKINNYNIEEIKRLRGICKENNNEIGRLQSIIEGLKMDCEEYKRGITETTESVLNLSRRLKGVLVEKEILSEEVERLQKGK